MEYRSDIDVLRAIAVLLVIAFHSGIAIFAGGYVGVDVFFVISGYLITRLIIKETDRNEFSFLEFYKRRAARLLPALSVTLLLVLAFGFIFYSTAVFDSLGKQVFFSSFGAANILFAQGQDYWTIDPAHQPLIHLWSLGVEEQFYLLWPLVCVLVLRKTKKWLFFIASVVFFVSLILSEHAILNNKLEGYYLLYFRSFELLIGCLLAILINRIIKIGMSERKKQVISYMGLAIILYSALFFEKSSSFPGLNALYPCIGAALIIAVPHKRGLTTFFSNRYLVLLGLISYPLYLFHQPVLSYIYFFNLNMSSVARFIVVCAVSVPLAWLTYKFIEKPTRESLKKKSPKAQSLILTGLFSTIPVFALAGMVVAKTDGLEARFKYLNPFALEISKAHSQTYHKNFRRGFRVSSGTHGEILFVGDSVLQQYILPITTALGVDKDSVDHVTRGGCVLLKGVVFVDQISDISCNEMRDDLYKSNKNYDMIVISQSWDSYTDSVLNFPDNKGTHNRWEQFLTETIKHFRNYTDSVVVIGGHLSVRGTESLQPRITARSDAYKLNLKKLEIANTDDLNSSAIFFSSISALENVSVIDPYEIFCVENCRLHDGKWAFFYDKNHISSASIDFVKSSLMKQLRDVNKK